MAGLKKVGIKVNKHKNFKEEYKIEENTNRIENLVEDKEKNKNISLSSFKFVEEIGSGTFGKVFKVIKEGSTQTYAMKILSKKRLISDNHLRYAVTECNVLKMASKNPFIVTLHFAFQVLIHNFRHQITCIWC
jgi:serine/threonine protein kinase